ncbi:Protein of unknown function, partial [Gryllus bimaculatus]
YRTYSTDQSRRSRSNVTGVQREHQKSVISLVDIAVNTPRRVFCSPICYRLDLFIREETFLKLLLESLSRKKMGECGVPEAGNWHLRVCSSGSIDDSLRLSGWHSGLFAHPRRCLELENIDHGIWDRSPNNRPEVRKTLRHKIIYVFP